MTQNAGVGVAPPQQDTIDLFSVRELVRRVRDLNAAEREALTFLLGAQLYWINQGSTRLSLASKEGEIDRIFAQWNIRAEVRRTVDQLLLEWRQDSLYGTGRLRELIGLPGEDKPLICDGNFLYSHRHLIAEQQVAHLLQRQTQNKAWRDFSHDLTAIGAELTNMGMSAEQQVAIERVLGNPLTLIAGGPGSGKTLVIGALCQIWSRYCGAETICLSAPTGKAVQRLADTVARFLPDQPPPRMATLHRLLGYEPRSGGFSFHQWCRLPGNLFIVDEASMIGLELWLHLLQALPEESSLVIVGDHRQLPAVAAGDGFRSILEVLAKKRPTLTAQLTKNFRVSHEHNALHTFARAINEGDTVASLATLSGGGQAIQHVSPSGEAEIAPTVLQWFRHQFSPPDKKPPLEIDERGQLTPLDMAFVQSEIGRWQKAQILCVGRNQPHTGSMAINLIVQREFAELTRQSTSSSTLAWQPVFVQRNDYSLGVFNGDMGIVIPAKHPDGTIVLRVAFHQLGAVATYPLSRLQSNIEPAFATTVHKSQGSEYDRVLLVLPDIDSPLLFRELLYTAATRARQQLTVVGSAALFELGIGRSNQRSSGLGDALAALL